MKARGTGLIFQPTWKDRKTGEIKTSSVWWVQYNVRGKRIRESSESRNPADAARRLKKRIGEAESGKPVGPEVEKTTLADLVSMIENDYKANNRRVSSIKAPLAHLVVYFGATCRAVDIRTDRITAYTTQRQERRRREWYDQPIPGRTQTCVHARGSSRQGGDAALCRDARRK